MKKSPKKKVAKKNQQNQILLMVKDAINKKQKNM